MEIMENTEENNGQGGAAATATSGTSTSFWKGPWTYWTTTTASTSTNSDTNTSPTMPPSKQPAEPSATTTSKETSVSKCPISSQSSRRFFMGSAASSKSAPASIEEYAKHAQIPQFADQTIPLSTHRVVSTIPRGSTSTADKESTTTTDAALKGCAMSSAASSSSPRHQPSGDNSSNNWVYPSEQQFYNAMRRKGYEASDKDMSFVIQIHNAVNERTWNHVMQWEQTLYPSLSENTRLVKFEGDSTKISPRAWLYTNLLGYKPPFDRHDWYIDRGDGLGLRRYVIDFYEGGGSATNPFSSSSQAPVNMFLDVRPAIDDFNSLKDRMEMFVRTTFPGIFHVADARRGTSSSSMTNNNNNNKNNANN